MTERATTGLKKVGVLTVLRHGSAMLLLRRSKKDELQGKYVPIGGHVDPFEPPREAAIREVREETGLVVEEVAFGGVLVETSPTRYNWVTFIYSAEVPRVAPPSCPEGTLEWVEAAALPGLPTPETDAHIYALLAAGQPFVLDAVYDADVRMQMLTEEISGRVLVNAHPR